LTEEDWENLCETLKGHLAKGRNFLKFANYTDAITELEQAVAIAPYRADVLVDCGKAHFGRWKETGTRLSRDRAETLFRKSLEIDPDNADAAEQLSLLKQSKPASRIRRKIAAMAAVLLLAGGVSAWVGIPGLSLENSGRLRQRSADRIAGSKCRDRTDRLPARGAPASPDPPVRSRLISDLVAHWTFDGSSPA
jgi:tetratricopeptide (TPR) repeat protein